MAPENYPVLKTSFKLLQGMTKEMTETGQIMIRGDISFNYRVLDKLVVDVHGMDDLQRVWYLMHFKNSLLEYTGDSFQDLFAQIAGMAFGADFETVRPYGNEGDLKCDGRLISQGCIFQCYAPYNMKESQLISKIKVDFFGAIQHWKDQIKVWVFVHNDKRGFPPGAVQFLDKLRVEHSQVKIEVWSWPELIHLFSSLSLSQCQMLYGYAPSLSTVNHLVLEDLKPVIDALERQEPDPLGIPVSPPSPTKLEKNSLSEEVKMLLQVGRRKVSLVEYHFSKNVRADLGERIAESFRRKYSELKELGISSDKVFKYMQDYAGHDGDPRRQGAALAVLAYFFDSCDIFEDPEEEVAIV